jgi:hypothetical protein
VRSTARELAFGCLVVAAISALGAVMALQGWRSRIPNPDTISSISGAYELVESGRLPDRGVLNSFRSYVPPGATWLFVPGARASSDPRVTEFPGAMILSIGTLIGVFVLARRHVGMRSAMFAVALYGLSELGVKYAGSVGPRGHPFFFVWMVAFTCEWVARRNAWFLAAAIGMWAAGMYVFLELAPALLMLPVVWVFFRPPIRMVPLAVVAVLALLVWLPYLRFESRRSFVDLKSQVFLQTLPTPDPPLQCDASLRFREASSAQRAAASPAERAVTRIGRRVLAIGTGSLATFGTVMPGVDVALLALTLGGIVALFRPKPSGPPAPYRRRSTMIGAAFLAGAVIFSVPVIRAFLGPNYAITAVTVSSVRTVQVLLVLAAIAMLAWRPLDLGLRRLRGAMDTTGADPRALITSLVVTWALCLLVVEYGRGERMSFLWPVQAILLATVAGGVSKLASITARRHIPASIGPAVVLAIVMAGPVMTTAAALRDSSWSGIDAEEVRVASDIADRIRGSGRTGASIGYQVGVAPTWGSWFVQSDPRYKIGADFDLLLMHPHGIVNTDRCGEGVSRDDEFRLIETRPPAGEVLEYVDVPPDASFKLVRTYESFELRQRR